MGRFLKDNVITMLIIVSISLALVFLFGMIFDIDVVILIAIALVINGLHFIKDYQKFRKEDRKYYHY